MNYRIWNKVDSINGVEAEYFISSLRIRETDGVFLIYNNDEENISAIEIDRIIKDNLGLDQGLSTDEVAQYYIRKREEDRENAQKEIKSLEELTKRVATLESENADLILDSAQKDIRMESLESDMADLMMEIAVMARGLN